MQEGRVTLQHVADEAGLSKAATSYALRGIKGSAETQERVRDIATRLGYTANPAALALAGGRSGAVGICGALRDLWQQGFAVRLAGQLRGHGFVSSIADTDADPDREREVAEGMVRRRVDGLITLGTDPAASWWADLPDGVAVVSVGEILPGRPSASSVVFDNVTGVSTALDHLIGLGHRRIGLLTGERSATPGRPAVRAAELALAGRDASLSVVAVSPSGREVVSRVRDLLDTPRRPTALFCLSDSIAFGAYRAARSLGLAIPDDVSVLGYDDHDLADLVTPPLSTFAWQEDAIAGTAIDLLVEALDGGPPRRAAFSPTFIGRASTGPPWS